MGTLRPGSSRGTCFPRTVRGVNLPHHDRPCKGLPHGKFPATPGGMEARLLGWSGAHRHLERQLPPLPHRPRRGLPPAPRDRRAGPAGDQGARGPAAADGAAGAGVRRRRRRHQPVERRRARLARRASTTSASASTPCPGTATRWPPSPGRSAPAAAASTSGRSTSPTAASPTTRTTSTSSTGWPGCARPPGSWLDGDTALVGDWNICPTDDDVFDPAQFREVHPRDAAGARRLPGLPRRRVRRGHPRARPGLHLLGLLPPALRARPRAQDRLRRRLALARRAGAPAPSSTATSATPRRAAGRPRTTRPSSSTWTELRVRRRCRWRWSMLAPWTS